MNPLIKQRSSPIRPAGEGKGAWLATLEQGANVLQDATPLKGFDVYVVGFHCPKNEPTEQMEAHHYCRVVNDDLLQCVLFDGNTREVNLIGIEYIISERLFGTLPDAERGYWHPHNFELLSGQLVAPGLPDVAEKAFFKLLMNSYGKTWHTGRHDGETGHGAGSGQETRGAAEFPRAGAPAVRGRCDEGPVHRHHADLWRCRRTGGRVIGGVTGGVGPPSAVGRWVVLSCSRSSCSGFRRGPG